MHFFLVMREVSPAEQRLLPRTGETPVLRLSLGQSEPHTERQSVTRKT